MPTRKHDFDHSPDYPGGDKIRKLRREKTASAIVKAIQLKLVKEGCLEAGDVTAHWDLKTKKAVKCLQRKKGLHVDGVPGPVTWEKAFNWKVPFSGSGNKDYPYIWFRPGVHIPPNKSYMQKLNAVGKEGYEKHGKRLVMVSGYRPCGSPSDSMYKSPATQWSLWRLYKAGEGNLAAVPCSSNHGKGYAADVGWEGKSGGGYVSYALAGSWTIDLLKRHGLKLPMWPPWSRQIESWHCELA